MTEVLLIVIRGCCYLLKNGVLYNIDRKNNHINLVIFGKNI
ncbi:hypothetical protein FLJC2902T_17080 [Flavobacterium limnosediminis JC2902]|uniref:Uncharacterized protein n=1 Tax=Flavobacterium limnosediminis JC2902 TaxID=1341181 RepID=V6SQ68_9FLAO|nr:hypothetical protein FLJC2902T_17080 [Flavobacterium limnosediminis JC2902]